MVTVRRQALWNEFWGRALQMQRQWIDDTWRGFGEYAMGNVKKAAEFMASAALALEASRACRNAWHLMRFHDLHLVPQLTTGADDGGAEEEGRGRPG